MSSWLTKNLAKLGIGEWLTENFPSADSADNDQSADVIGNKTDTVGGDSLVAVAKQNAAAIAVVDAFHDVPAQDSSDNVVISDVIGNKSDTHDGNSIYATGHILNEHAHSPSKVYPTMEDGVVVTSSGTAWTLGAAATIIGTTKNLDNAAAADQGGDPNVVRIPCTGHGYVVGNNVTIAGSINYNGTFEIVAVSDADHFDIESAFTAETFDGGGAETAIDVITEDFDIHFLSIEDLSANGVYEIVIYDDGTEVGRTRVTKNAVQDGTVNAPIQTSIIAAGSVITAKAATDNAAGDTVTISIFYHTY